MPKAKAQVKKEVSSSNEESSEPISEEEFSDSEVQTKKKKNVLNRSEKTKSKKSSSKSKIITKGKTPTKATPQKPNPSKRPAQQKTGEKKAEKEEKINKNHFLPGQKHLTPQDGDGTRAFYESLYEQKPESKMAEKWCLENGLLDKEKALEIVKKNEKSKKK